MKSFILNGKIFSVVEDFEKVEPSVPLMLFDDKMKMIGMISAGILAETGLPIPECHLELYAKKINEAIANVYSSIDIRLVLRLWVHNETYISYSISPRNLEDIEEAEGMIFCYSYNKEKKKDELYVGRSTKELISCVTNGITADKHRGIGVIHDNYFEEAIETLFKMYKAEDVCAVPVIVSKEKDPNSKVLKAEDDKGNPRKCKWCIEMGFSGNHLNHWHNDATVYQDPMQRTGYRHYGRVKDYGQD